jgi:hypothetical protein
MTRSHAAALTALAAILFACTTGIDSAWSAPFGAPHPLGAMPTSSLMSWIFAEQAAFYRVGLHPREQGGWGCDVGAVCVSAWVPAPIGTLTV